MHGCPFSNTTLELPMPRDLPLIVTLVPPDLGPREGWAGLSFKLGIYIQRAHEQPAGVSFSAT